MDNLCWGTSHGATRAWLAALLVLSIFAGRLAPVRAEDAHPLFDEAQRAFAQRDYERARDLLERAKQQDPGWHELDFNLGVAAEASGRYDAAILHYRTYAAHLAPRDGREVELHAAALADYQRRAADAPRRKRLPWWLWVALGGVVVAIGAGAAVATSGDSGEEY